MTVPRHVCVVNSFVPSPVTSVPRHDCAHTIVYVHDCAQTRSCLWTIIVIVFTRLCVNFIGENTSILKYCWRNEVKLVNHCSAITRSIHAGILRSFIFPIKIKLPWYDYVLLIVTGIKLKKKTSQGFVFR